MRINKIRLKNYRQHKDLQITFDKKNEYDLYVFIGLNGIGKTNLLNAINWCLYGDEPHLSNDSQQYPLLNSTILSLKDDETHEVVVELYVETDDHKPLTFTRKRTYKISNNNGNHPEQEVEVFEVSIPDKKNNTIFHQGEEANNVVKRFVPKNIREYFLFDGERLDNYFKDVTGKKIQSAISGISQIDLLITLENRLKNVSNNYRKEIGKNNPDIDSIRKELEEKKKRLEELNSESDETKTNISEAKSRLDELEKKLKGIPDISELENQRVQNTKKKDEIEQLMEKKIKEREKHIFNSFIKIALYEPVKSNLDLIKTKQKKKEIPVVEDKDLVKDIAEKGFCKICGRELDDEAKKWVEKLLDQYKISSSVSNELIKMQIPLKQMMEQVDQYKTQKADLEDEISHYDRELHEVNKTITEINSNLETYKDEEVSRLQKERSAFETSLKNLLKKTGQLEERIKNTSSEIKKKEELFEKESRKTQKNEDNIKRLEFSEKAIEITRKSKDQVLNEIRKKIEEETNTQFFNLIWKKETFKEIEITPDYEIILYSKDGIPMLGSVGKAESELLALAFTLGLHNISGFEAPIIIDTPVARISGDQRVAFGKTLVKISKEKQIILLFTPDEYTNNIREIIEPNASGKFTFKMLNNEKETAVEVKEYE